MLYWFRVRNGDPNPPGQNHGWDGGAGAPDSPYGLKGSIAGLYMMVTEEKMGGRKKERKGEREKERKREREKERERERNQSFIIPNPLSLSPCRGWEIT